MRGTSIFSSNVTMTFYFVIFFVILFLANPGFSSFLIFFSVSKCVSFINFANNMILIFFEVLPLFLLSVACSDRLLKSA